MTLARDALPDRSWSRPAGEASAGVGAAATRGEAVRPASCPQGSGETRAADTAAARRGIAGAGTTEQDSTGPGSTGQGSTGQDPAEDGTGDERADDLLAGPATLRASLRIDDPRWRPLDPPAVAGRVLHALACHGFAPPGGAECDIVFATDAELARLNAAFRGRDRPTNVLAFPSGAAAGPGGGPADLGGIALAYGVMASEAVERGIPLARHTTHLTLHGLLHLLGHDHVDEEDRARMERTEIAILAGLGIPDPYSGS